MVVAATFQIGDQLRVGQGVWRDCLQFPVRSHGGWFAMFVPIAKLLAPELLRENLFSALKPFRDFGLWGWQDLTIAEAVHVAHLKAVDQQPIEAGEVVSALLDGGRMCLLPIASHWARHVHGVLCP